MKYKEIESGIFDLLDENAELRRSWAQSPHVTHVPFMGNRESFFLLICLYVKPEWTDRGKQISECLAVARIAIASDLLRDERAVEVAAYVDEEKKPRRVIRWSVLNTAFAQAMKIEAADLLSEQHEGFACHWPLLPHK